MAKKMGQLDRILLEAREIEQHPDKMTREDGFSLGRALKPLIHDMKERK
jgi:hypothetical protein